jgi:YVTN family beta-propeller protein
MKKRGIKIFFLMVCAVVLKIHGEPFAYVTNSSDATISIIDTATQTVVNTVSTAPHTSPRGIAVTPDGTQVYVTHFTQNTVSIFDVDGNTLVFNSNFSIAPGASPSSIAITPDGTLAYVADVGGLNVTKINLPNTVNTLATSGFGPISVAISPDGAFAYFANSLNNVLTALDTSDDSETSIFLGIPNTSSRGLAVTPDSAFVYVAINNNARVSVIRTSDFSIVTEVTGITSPFGVAITPDGSIVYVTSLSGDSVRRIQTSDNTLLPGTISVGDGPQGIAVTLDGAFVYVVNNISDDVSIIRTSDNMVIATLAVGNSPMNIAMAPLSTVQPPTNFQGVATCSTPTEYLLTLTWDASATVAVTEYRIFEDGVLIGTVQATDPLEFQTTITSLLNPERFTIIAVTGDDRESDPVALTTITSTCVMAPSNFIGSIIQNRFLNRVDFVLFAQWTASISENVAAYRILYNGQLIATIAASDSLVFVHTMAAPNQALGITIVAVNADGVISNPESLTII